MINGRLLLAVTMCVIGLTTLVAGGGAGLAQTKPTAIDSTGRSRGSNPRIVRIPWNARMNGIAEFGVNRATVWVLSRGISFGGRSNVWHITSRDLKTRYIAKAPSFEVFAPASTAVWGTTLRQREFRPTRSVVRVPLPISDRRTMWPTPPVCQKTLGSLSVTFGNAFWLDCRTAVLRVTSGSRSTDLRRVQDLQAMLPARNGLWLIEGRRVHAVAGRAVGESFMLPAPFDIIASATFANRAWAVAGSPSKRHLRLLELDFAERTTRSAVLESRSSFLEDLEVVGNELWAADAATSSIVRFTRFGARIGEVNVRPRSGYRYRFPFLMMAAGRKHVWVAVNGPPFGLYRITP